MAKSYTVEVLANEDAEGRSDWVTAARRCLSGAPRQMSYGAANNVDADEAIYLHNMLEASGSKARIVENKR